MRDGARSATSVSVPAWVLEALGPDLADVGKLAWGFTNETWGATTPAGDRYALTRMASTAAAEFVLRNGPEVARRVGIAGLEMPAPIAELSRPADRVVVSRWIDGVPAMQLLSARGGAEQVGRAIGDAWRQLADVDVAALGLDATWAGGRTLATTASDWLASVGPGLRASAARSVGVVIDAVSAQPSVRRSGFVHGDLVPANVLLRPSGPVLVDFEAARIGDRLFDAAWFRWIVAYHHPELAADAWRAFARAAALPPDGGDPVLLDAYPVLRILEILAGGELSEASRARWVQQLDAALARLETLAVPGDRGGG